MRRLLKDNLLLQFSVVSFVVMVGIAVVLAIVLSNKIQSDALNALASEAIGSAGGRVLTAITPADLEVPMTGTRYDTFDRFVRRSVVSERTARVKVYAKDGTIIYCTDPAAVGSKYPNNTSLLRALYGEIATRIKSPTEPENARERHLGTLMEVYTPIIFPGTVEPQGALEIYQYYAPTAQRINELRRWLFGSIGVGFVILYVGLVSIVRRSWKTIKQQQTAIAVTNDELRTANDELHEAQDKMGLILSETKIRAEKLRALADLSRTVTGTLDPTQVFDLIIRASSELLDAPVASIWTLEGEEIILRADRGYESDLRVDRRLRLGEGISGWIAQHKQPVVISEFVEDPRAKNKEWALAEGLHAFAGFPLLVGKRCVGVLNVIRRSPRCFGPDEVELLSTFADQAAVAVENAKLYEQLKEMTVLEERERIAREMHDGLAQQLGYLHLEIAKLENDISSQPAVREELRQVKEVAARAYEEARKAIFGLRTVVSRSLGLIPILTEYLHDLSEQTGIEVELEIADERATRLSAHAEVQLVRIIQEALANVRKHAHAKRAWVIFDSEGGNAKITVRDDGRGFDLEEVTRFERVSLGLQSMRERAELVGGKLKVESRRGKGTQVIVWLPI
ncbi:MAG: GAF domain-containing protein [Candidatus Methylomirabilales bacterium]